MSLLHKNQQQRQKETSTEYPREKTTPNVGRMQMSSAFRTRYFNTIFHYLHFDVLEKVTGKRVAQVDEFWDSPPTCIRHNLQLLCWQPIRRGKLLEGCRIQQRGHSRILAPRTCFCMIEPLNYANHIVFSTCEWIYLLIYIRTEIICLLIYNPRWNTTGTLKNTDLDPKDLIKVKATSWAWPKTCFNLRKFFFFCLIQLE